LLQICYKIQTAGVGATVQSRANKKKGLSMRLRYVISTLSLLVCGCGASGTDTPSTPPPNPADASALFLPVSAFASNGSLDARSTGLFVFSSKSPEDLPKQITTQPVTQLGAHVQQTLDAQGVVSAGNPDQLFYTTFDPSGDNHVWLLDVTVPAGSSRNSSAA
jgi:hypothetical protein